MKSGFPTDDLAQCDAGGPERRTDVVVLGSGHEERNSRWANSRRSYNAGYGVKSLDDLHAVIAFFEERRGRLHGFRWRDHADWKSCPPSATTDARSIRRSAPAPAQRRRSSWSRPTARACALVARDHEAGAGTVLVAVAGVVAAEGTALRRRSGERAS